MKFILNLVVFIVFSTAVFGQIKVADSIIKYESISNYYLKSSDSLANLFYDKYVYWRLKMDSIQDRKAIIERQHLKDSLERRYHIKLE